jgi:hypothetical protein
MWHKGTVKLKRVGVFIAVDLVTVLEQWGLGLTTVGEP